MRKRYRILGGMALLALALDQLSKYIVMQTIPEHRPVPVIQGLFDLVNIRNRGAAFGFLNRSDIEWQFWLFLAATLVAAGVVVMLAKNSRADDTPFFIALGLILGGAVGNLIDRVRYREVVDFLDFYHDKYHWPAFNVADIAICCGAALALILSLRRSPPEKAGR